MTYIRVKFSNNEVWLVPAEVVATSYATYYNKIDNDTTLEEEYDYIIYDDNLLIDWACNNMDWSDVSDMAVLEEFASIIDRDREWSNADKEVRRP